MPGHRCTEEVCDRLFACRGPGVVVLDAGYMPLGGIRPNAEAQTSSPSANATATVCPRLRYRQRMNGGFLIRLNGNGVGARRWNAWQDGPGSGGRDNSCPKRQVQTATKQQSHHRSRGTRRSNMCRTNNWNLYRKNSSPRQFAYGRWIRES